MRILAWLHAEIEPPGRLADVVAARGGCIESNLVPAEGVRDPRGYDGLLIMGGPQSANDTHLPYIRRELELLRRLIAEEVPILGICLGAQLLARAAGAAITPAPMRELGWFRVTPTPGGMEDPLFESLPGEGLHVFQWHGETFSLPEGAVLLATAEHVPHQAFRLGRRQYGLQFHVEADAGMVERWLAAGEEERRHLGASGIAALRADHARHMENAHAFCRRMGLAWLERCRTSP